MAIWFQLPTIWSWFWKKEEEKEQFMSKAPTASNTSSISKNTQPTASNKANVMPREPMMSYDIEWTIMPWVTDNTANNLKTYAKANSSSPQEEKLMLNDMYQEAVKLQQRKAYEKDREATKAEMVQKSLKATDPEEKKSLTTAVKLANLSDVIREAASQQWFDAYGMNDKDLVAWFGENNPDKQETIVSYLNWQIDSVELGKQIWAIPADEIPMEEDNVILWETPLDTPIEKEWPMTYKEMLDSWMSLRDIMKESRKNVWEWLVSFAWSLPKVIAETWILDNTMDKLSSWKIWDFIREATWKVFSDEQIKAFQEENKGKTFSEFSAWSQVWWNPESKTAKTVEWVLDVAEATAGIASLVKWISRWVAKKSAKKSIKKVTDIIADPEKTKDIQKALKEKRLVETTSWKIKRWLIWEKGAKITPSKKIEEAADIIQKNIKKPAETPTWLYNQIIDYVSNKSKALSSKLKNIKIGNNWDKATVKMNLKELAENTDEFTKAEIKNISDFSTKFNKIKNLDEFWNLRKDFDNMFSDTIKQWYGKSWSTWRAYKVWKATRDVMNEWLDDMAKNISNVSTKEEFKSISAMLNAANNIKDKIWTNILKPTSWLISKKNIVKWAVTAWLWTAWIKFLAN